MNIKSTEQINLMRKSGHITAIILSKLSKIVKPGTKTIDIENYAQQLIKKYKVSGAFKNFQNYPYNTCISINDEIVHGLPSERKIKQADIVSIDFGVNYQGYNSDAAITICLDKSSKIKNKLVKQTRESLYTAIKNIKPGIRLGNIQNIIYKHAVKNNLKVIKDLTGHFIGKSLQEKPSIPNYAKPETGIILKKGMTFCLEPMLALGSDQVSIDNDGWTITTSDHSLSAHFEHTILVSEKGYEILTEI